MAIASIGADIGHALPGDDLQNVRPIGQTAVMRIRRGDTLAADAQQALEQLHRTGQLLFDPRPGQAAQVDVVGAFFDDGLQRKVFVCVLGDLEPARRQAGFELRPESLDVAADDEQRRRHVQFAMHAEARPQEISRPYCGPVAGPPILAGYAPGMRSTS